MIKTYTFNYEIWDAKAVFEVDTEKFTPELANATLEFFYWDYDKDNDPIHEVMHKYAIRAIELATFNNHNTFGVTEDFKDEEGYGPVDGSIGLTLKEVEMYEFAESSLELTIS